MIQNNKLIIDKNCPVCKGYGKLFITCHLLDKQTIAYYQTVNQKVFDQIDAERAKNEVAFINPRSGKVIYGIDAFLCILSQKSVFLKWFFNLAFIHFLALKLYRFISFNRHIISGINTVEDARNCIPETHKAYRWLYIGLLALFTGFIVNHFTLLVDAKLGIEHAPWREYIICFGQIGWQFLALYFINPIKRLDYLGNMTTVSTIGALLLLPLFLFNYLVDLHWIAMLIGFVMVVLTMLFIHIKRCKRMGLPLITSVSWVVYRSVVLIILFILFLN